MATFRERINQLFEKAKDLDYNLTQEAFADRFGATRNQLTGWFGGRGEPDSEMMKIIAEKCGVSVDWLVGKSDDRNPDTSVKAIDDPEVQEFMKTVISEFRTEKNIPEKAKQEIMEDLAEYFKMKMNQAKRKAENK